MIVRVGVGAAPFVVVLHVLFEGRLHAVDHQRLVIQAVQSAFAAGAVVGGEHDERVVVLAGAFEGGDHAADLLVGLRHHAGEDFHLAGVELLLVGAQTVPARDFRNAGGEFGAGRDDLHLQLLSQNHLPRLVPAHVELALVHVDVLLLDLMRRVHGAGRPEQEERPIGINRGVRGEVVDGAIGQIGGEVIIRRVHPSLRWTMIVPQQRAVIVRIGSHEAVEMVEALAAGPVVERAAAGSFRQGRVIPFADREGFKAGVLEMLGDGFRALGRSAVVAGEAHRGERMRTQADPVRIPARHQRRPRRRAQGRGVKVVVAQAIGGQRIDVRRLDEAAEAAVLGKAHVIEKDDEHVGRARFWFPGFGIPLHGFLVGLPDLAFELLAVFLER